MNPMIKKVESVYIKDEKFDLKIGDSVEVGIKIIEGKKERVQLFSGIIIGMKGEGINKSIKVRKLSFGIGVEKNLPLHAPNVVSFKVVRRAKVRRAKLYYLRDRVGKKATKLKLAK